MADMTPSHGKDMVVWIDDSGSVAGAVQMDISRHVMSIDGLPGEREFADITCGGGALAHEYLAGPSGGDITMVCLMDDSTINGYPPWTYLYKGTTGDILERTLTLFPNGTGAGYPQITAEVRFKSLNFPAKPLEALTFTAVFSLGTDLDIGLSS